MFQLRNEKKEFFFTSPPEVNFTNQLVQKTYFCFNNNFRLHPLYFWHKKTTQTEKVSDLFSSTKAVHTILAKLNSWIQSYQTLIFLLSRFLLISLSVCSLKNIVCTLKWPSLTVKKQKKSSFYEEESLVGLTLELKFSVTVVFFAPTISSLHQRKWRNIKKGNFNGLSPILAFSQCWCFL